MGWRCEYVIIGIVSNPGWYIIYGMFELLQGYNSQVAVTWQEMTSCDLSSF